MIPDYICLTLFLMAAEWMSPPPHPNLDSWLFCRCFLATCNIYFLHAFHSVTHGDMEGLVAKDDRSYETVHRTHGPQCHSYSEATNAHATATFGKVFIGVEARMTSMNHASVCVLCSMIGGKG